MFFCVEYNNAGAPINFRPLHILHSGNTYSRLQFFCSIYKHFQVLLKRMLCVCCAKEAHVPNIGTKPGVFFFALFAAILVRFITFWGAIKNEWHPNMHCMFCWILAQFGSAGKIATILPTIPTCLDVNRALKLTSRFHLILNSSIRLSCSKCNIYFTNSCSGGGGEHCINCM